MVRILAFLSAALVATLSVAALPAETAPEASAAHDALAFTIPNKHTVWHWGSRVKFNWINPPQGTLNLKLIGDSFTVISTKTDAQLGNKDATCDHTSQNLPCGRYDWIPPQNIKPGKYRAMIVSNEDQTKVAISEEFTIQN